MKTLVALLVALLLLLQYKLWVGPGSFAEVWRFSRAIVEQHQHNTGLEERNNTLEAEVLDFKEGQDAVEERARSELGMIKPDETFYQVVEE
jgi:cell division protein FtsB